MLRARVWTGAFVLGAESFLPVFSGILPACVFWLVAPASCADAPPYPGSPRALFGSHDSCQSFCGPVRLSPACVEFGTPSSLSYGPLRPSCALLALSPLEYVPARMLSRHASNFPVPLQLLRPAPNLSNTAERHSTSQSQERAVEWTHTNKVMIPVGSKLKFWENFPFLEPPLPFDSSFDSSFGGVGGVGGAAAAPPPPNNFGAEPNMVRRP